MDKALKSVTEQLCEHADRLKNSDLLNASKPLLVRLASSLVMENIWQTLSKNTDDSQKLIDLLDYIRLHPALAGNPNDPITILGDNSQRDVFQSITVKINRLRDELKDLSDQRDANDGWRLLESTLGRAETESLKQGVSGNFLEIKQLQHHLATIQATYTIIDILEVMSKTAEYAATAPDARLPKKRNTPRAKQNQLAMDLKRYLKQHFDTESPSMIATIVNIAFNYPNAAISADDVRKLKI
ncbi:MAG: hypothetical protein K2V71_08870 [Methylotenera sp.]|nr:hypothetical protein [Methylotenera sp.]